ncbi:hypothetical protein B0O99DRAFT_693437 [Bisporella sp. PMI_857]|nr:hypothetical protein B0O99DRAFT_693437 [Bisporella sp. PMI_857]
MPIIKVAYLRCCRCCESTLRLESPDACYECGHLECEDCDGWEHWTAAEEQLSNGKKDDIRGALCKSNDSGEKNVFREDVRLKEKENNSVDSDELLMSELTKTLRLDRGTAIMLYGQDNKELGSHIRTVEEMVEIFGDRENGFKSIGDWASQFEKNKDPYWVRRGSKQMAKGATLLAKLIGKLIKVPSVDNSHPMGTENLVNGASNPREINDSNDGNNTKSFQTHLAQKLHIKRNAVSTPNQSNIAEGPQRLNKPKNNLDRFEQWTNANEGSEGYEHALDLGRRRQEIMKWLANVEATDGNNHTDGSEGVANKLEESTFDTTKLIMEIRRGWATIEEWLDDVEIMKHLAKNYEFQSTFMDLGEDNSYGADIDREILGFEDTSESIRSDHTQKHCLTDVTEWNNAREGMKKLSRQNSAESNRQGITVKWIIGPESTDGSDITNL